MPLNFAHSISKKYLTSYIDRYIRYKFNLKDGNPDFRYGYMTTKERKELVSTVFESELPRVRSAIRAKFCFDTYINASVIYYKAKAADVIQIDYVLEVPIVGVRFGAGDTNQIRLKSFRFRNKWGGAKLVVSSW